MSNHRYRIHGINLSSNAVLPGLRPSNAKDSDVQLAVCSYSPDNIGQSSLTDAIYVGRYELSSGDLDEFIFYGFESHYVLSWKQTVDFHIAKDGSSIRCYPWESMDWERDLRPFVFGRALPFALNLQGVLTLHSSGVQLPGGVVSFVADSGTGKSTLATYLSCKGHPFVAYDVLAVRRTPNGYFASFGSSQVRLNDESLNFLNSQIDTPMTGEPDYDKTRLNLCGGDGIDEYLPLRTVYLLSRSKEESETEVEIHSVPAREALPLLLANTTNITFYETIQLKEQFALISQLVQQVPVKRLVYGSHFDSISKVYDAILADQSTSLQSVVNYVP